MTWRAELLESIPQTKYLSAENFLSYRAIMRLFYLEHQNMRYQLDPDELLTLLRGHAGFEGYPYEGLIADLNQLTKWENLIPIQDPHKVYTIADFKNRQYRYMMSQPALEVERMTIALENLSTHAAGLSSSAFRRILAALRAARQLDTLPPRQVGEWWEDLQEDFRRLSQNHQDYLREFYSPSTEKQMKTMEFMAHKQQLIRYLEEFVQDLQRSSAQIGALLESLSPEEVAHILELVCKSGGEVPPAPSRQSPRGQEEAQAQARGVWQSLVQWFIGDESTARQVMEITNEVIRRVVQNAALLIQVQNMGVSNQAELNHLLGLFAHCPDLDTAHRLSAHVFGAQQARHFSVNAPRETERIDLSSYEEAPLDYLLQPRVRTYRPRQERSGFADKSAEKAARRKQLLEEERRLRQRVMGFIQNGRLDFSTLSAPVPPEVRDVLLSWVVKADLSPGGRGRTEYGQTFTLRRRADAMCRMVCTDGVLTMPDYVLVFEEADHV